MNNQINPNLHTELTSTRTNDSNVNMATAPATEKRPDIIELAHGLNHIPQGEDYERMISGML